MGEDAADQSEVSIWSRDPVCTNHSSPEDDEDVADHGDDDEEAQHQDGQHRLPVQVRSLLSATTILLSTIIITTVTSQILKMYGSIGNFKFLDVKHLYKSPCQCVVCLLCVVCCVSCKSNIL